MIIVSYVIAANIIGKDRAEKVAEVAIELYKSASAFARQHGIIIADTKFEFGIDKEGALFLVDEALTPDSSRFWPLDDFNPGRSQKRSGRLQVSFSILCTLKRLFLSWFSFDKQYVRDYLTSIEFDKNTPVELPQGVVENTLKKYIEVYKILTGEEPVL